MSSRNNQKYKPRIDKPEMSSTTKVETRHFRTHDLTAYFAIDNSLKLGYIVVFLLIIFVRLCVSIGDYSGMNKPPMYGDYEAQRHWMEITYNLPINEWYVNTTDNNLEYWGLDYPPLTAYHSFICGFIASYIYPELIELNKSHGIETYETKFFMRMTVLISDIIFFISAVYAFFEIAYPKQKWNIRITAIFCMLLNPLFIIIDHGHYQYNCVALGLTLWSINAMITDHYYISSILFVSSFCFKQMSLFYAFPYFFYLIGISYKSNQYNITSTIYSIILIGLTVLTTVLVIFSPWILNGNLNELNQVIHRIFPFERGLFEDKVANFWCCTNIIIKWKILFGVKWNKILSLFMTLLTCSPCILLIFKPKAKYFLYSLCISSLSFYLFSYQVHEKNIMFALMPISLFILEAPYYIGGIIWISMFSMIPLLKKDGLLYYYWILQIIFYATTSWIRPLTNMTQLQLTPEPPLHPLIERWKLTQNFYKNNNNFRNSYPIQMKDGHAPPCHYAPLWWCYQPYITVLLYFMTATVQFSERYPDIGVYLIMMYCCAIFGFAWILFTLQFILEYRGVFQSDVSIILCDKLDPNNISKKRKMT